ncbi:M23 family metallopeptidase [Rhodococcus sp. UNC363MFTsu5.1]|uniref:M23 family metallopeptidase n=1 Tax=Rhodococcus sp. UNC363MFTsu5.1 TaxID=1449069 RepID=UPI000488BDE4|nr:M23 family metallopeptidase [Rhodococcus sp. UNC363MFTsu5.1]
MRPTSTRVAHRRIARSTAGVLAAAITAALTAGTAAAATPRPDVADPSLVGLVAGLLSSTPDEAADTLVDPALWQTIANITSDSLENAEANGSLADLVSAQRGLSECLSPYAAADAELAVAACSDEFTAIDPMLIVRLLAAIELGQTDGEHPGHDADTATLPDESPSGETDSESAVTEDDTGGRTGSAPSTRRVVAPTAGSVTSTFGDGRKHAGIDIANTLGSPIVAVADGEVISAGPAKGFGLWVRIRHDDGTVTTYGHNNDNTVSVGQRVRAGQRIATVGNRGNSTGPHLHFEVESPSGDTVDPLEWLTTRGASVLGPED